MTLPLNVMLSKAIELKKCVSLWGELVSVGEWVFTAERCVMLRRIHYVTQLVTLLTLGIVTVGSQHVTCNTWHLGRDDTFTYPDNAHSQHEMTWHQEIQSYISTFLQEKKFVSIVIHIVHYIIAFQFIRRMTCHINTCSVVHQQYCDVQKGKLICMKLTFHIMLGNSIEQLKQWRTTCWAFVRKRHHQVVHWWQIIDHKSQHDRCRFRGCVSGMVWSGDCLS